MGNSRSRRSTSIRITLPRGPAGWPELDCGFAKARLLSKGIQTLRNWPVSRIKDKTLEHLLEDKGVIRNRLKLFSIRSNAHAALAIQKEFGSLESYFWQFVDNHPIDGGGRSASDIPAKTELSDALSKDLKKRGFKFIGSTICYAFLQAGGFINDHVGECFRYSEQKEVNDKNC